MQLHVHVRGGTKRPQNLLPTVNPWSRNVFCFILPHVTRRSLGGSVLRHTSLGWRVRRREEGADTEPHEIESRSGDVRDISINGVVPESAAGG